MDDNNNKDKDLFEETDTIKDYEKLNYIKNKNGTKKIRYKLPDNIIDDLYIFKKK